MRWLHARPCHIASHRGRDPRLEVADTASRRRGDRASIGIGILRLCPRDTVQAYVRFQSNISHVAQGGKVGQGGMVALLVFVDRLAPLKDGSFPSLAKPPKHGGLDRGSSPWAYLLKAGASS